MIWILPYDPFEDDLYCQKLNQTKDKTIEALMQECGITEDEAKEYICLYWQEER